MNLSDNDRDAMTRIVLAENRDADPSEQAAIAHVMLNRLQSGQFGSSMQAVLNARTKSGGYQFTPLGTAKNNPSSINPSSPAYRATAQVINGVVDGTVPDPTGGATYYRNQDIAPGRPAGVAGGTIKIGAHTFFGGSETMPSDLSPDKYGTDEDPLVQKYAGGQATIGNPGTIDPKDYGTDNDPLVQKYASHVEPQAPPTSPAQHVAQDFGSFPGAGAQEPSYAPLKLTSDLQDLIRQHPNVTAAMVAGMNIPIAAGVAAAAPGLVAKTAWPLIRTAAPYFAADEAARHAEATYNYGKNLLSGFQE